MDNWGFLGVRHAIHYNSDDVRSGQFPLCTNLHIDLRNTLHIKHSAACGNSTLGALSLSFNIVMENGHIKANESQFDVRNSMEGRPKLKETELRRKNDGRPELTAKARVTCGETRHVLKSLQPCSLRNNRHVLQHIVQQTSPSNDDKRKKIAGLLAVLDALQCEHIGVDGKAYDNSILRFEEAMELFFAHHNKGQPFINTDKDKFLYALLHEEWGLCVYIVFVECLNQRLVILRPDSCNLDTFLDMLSKAAPRSSSMTEDTLQLHAENVHEILATVDTEWDRKVARVLLASEQSR